MDDNNIFHVTITHKIMVAAESHEHAERIARAHLSDKLAEWPLNHEVGDCASVAARQAPITNENDLAEGYRDIAPWSDNDEDRTCREILRDREKMVQEQRSKKD